MLKRLLLVDSENVRTSLNEVFCLRINISHKPIEYLLLLNTFDLLRRKLVELRRAQVFLSSFDIRLNRSFVITNGYNLSWDRFTLTKNHLTELTYRNSCFSSSLTLC